MQCSASHASYPLSAAILVGRTELAPNEKQTDRRAKKASRRKARADDKLAWKAKLKANPELAIKVDTAVPPRHSLYTRHIHCAAHTAQCLIDTT